jgi:hypothetical protein
MSIRFTRAVLDPLSNGGVRLKILSRDEAIVNAVWKQVSQAIR